jgi:hypothetical protein
MKKYTVIEILPFYLQGRKIKRDIWEEVEYIQFKKNFSKKNDKYNNETSCYTKYTKEYIFNIEKENNKNQQENELEDIKNKLLPIIFLSPLSVIEKFGINQNKKWIIVD